jgi:multidrug efflux pump subunit AcrB
MAKTELPSSVSWSFGGDVEENSKAQNKLLGALGFGLILIVGVLVLQFNSFKKMLLIASVIPLGLIGVLLTSLIANEPISFISMFGFVALAGIVVNNSIILIDVFGNLEEGTLSKEDVVVEGSKRRLRPILLTSATTIIGMVPLLFSSPMWRPLAVSIAGGLTFATIITLILVPVLYYRKSNKNKDKTL